MAFGFGFGMPRSFAVPPFSPASLFVGGIPGVWYDPSDYSTLFQDSAGTTPVTAVEQPVGLMLDKSQGLVLGSEATSGAWLNTNTTAFDTFTSTGPASFTATTTGAKSPRTAVAANLPAAGWYWVDFTATYTGGVFNNIGFSNTGSQYSAAVVTTATPVSGARFQTLIYTSAPREFLTISFIASGASTLSVTGVSVKSLAGNHAFQSTSASRPVLSARYNLLTKTEQFDDAAWTKRGTVSVTPNAIVAPDGLLTADLISGVNALGSSDLFQSSANVATGVALAPSFYIQKVSSTGILRLNNPASSSNGNWSIDLSLVASGWVRITETHPSVTVTTAFTGSGAANGGLQFAATTGGPLSFYLWGAQLIVTNSLTSNAYQRVNTATDYATTGFLPYLKFDGVDDSLSTNSISFTSTDKMSVFAGVRKLGTASSILVELSATVANSGTFSVQAPGASGTDTYLVGSNGSILEAATATGYSPPITNTLTGLCDISGDRITLRVNGVQAAQNTANQGTGNYGNYPLFIGRRNNTNLPFNGQIYSMVIVGKAVTATELANTEKYVALETGFTAPTITGVPTIGVTP
jgi:hypothetical protein